MTTTDSDTSAPQPQPQPPSNGPKRGRPRKNWSEEAVTARSRSRQEIAAQASPSDTTVSEPSLSTSTSLSSTLVDTFGVSDLDLLHSYTLHTASTVGERVLWQESVPQLGFRHSCVLHAVMAISAYHIVKLRPTEPDLVRFLELADHHTTASVKQATDMLPCLGRDNCQALYITTVLMAFTAFAKGPAPGDLLVVSRNGRVPWLSLLRGVRLVLTSMGNEAVFSGILALKENPEEAQELSAQHATPHPLLMLGWQDSLSQLSQWIDTMTDPDSARVYRREIRVLTPLFETTFGTDDEVKAQVEGKFQIIMSWLYQLDSDIMERMEQRDPPALVLLGHFAVLVYTLESFWFMEGWGTHLLDEAREALGLAYTKWLTWPIAYLEASTATSPISRAST